MTRRDAAIWGAAAIVVVAGLAPLLQLGFGGRLIGGKSAKCAVAAPIVVVLDRGREIRAPDERRRTRPMRNLQGSKMILCPRGDSNTSV